MRRRPWIARCRALAQLAGLVTPDTILHWYRELIAKKHDGAPQRGRGRPDTTSDQHDQAHLTEHGLSPALARGKTMPWRTFMKAYFDVIAATDFVIAVLAAGYEK